MKPSENIDVDYIIETPMSSECRRVTVMQFDKSWDLAVGEVLGLYAREGLIGPDTLRINWDQYQPIGCLYADHYIRAHDRFSMNIPAHENMVDQKQKNNGE